MIQDLLALPGKLLSGALGGLFGGGEDQSYGQGKELKDGEDFYRRALEDQKRYHPVWYRNIAFLMGQHWLDWSNATNWFSTPPAPSWRVRLVVNLVLPKVRTEVAKILRTNPAFYVVPANDSDEARQGARVGTRLLESKYYDDQYQRKLYNLAMWFVSCGTGFLWSLWDGKAGKTWRDREMDPATGEAVLDPQTGEPRMKDYHVGEVIPDVSGPFETLLDPGAPEDFYEHRRIMRIKIRDVDYIKDKYGVEVPPEDLKSESLLNMRIASFSGLQGGPSQGGPDSRERFNHHAMVKEYFELASSKYAEGRHFAYAGGKVLLPTEPLDYWLNSERALPCGKFDHITVPGRAWGMSLIEQIAGLNETFNKMSSQVIENANLMSRPKVIVAEDSLDEDSWTSEPGEVVEARIVPGFFAPIPWTPPEMPRYFFEMKDSLPPLIDRISSIHDISEGRLPRRATSGKAIDLLQEADDTNIGLTLKNFGSSLERTMNITLGTIQRKYGEERLLRKIGPSHQIEVFTFKKEDLRGSDTVRVVIGPALSRSSKVQLGMEMAEKQLIPADMALKIMELGDLNIAFDRDADQLQYAKFENMGMAKGLLYPVGQFEPHRVHISEHKRFLNSPEAQALPPEVRKSVEDHITEHEAREAVRQQMMMGANPLPGSPMPAGPGGG